MIDTLERLPSIYLLLYIVLAGYELERSTTEGAWVRVNGGGVQPAGEGTVYAVTETPGADLALLAYRLTATSATGERQVVGGPIGVETESDAAPSCRCALGRSGPPVSTLLLALLLAASWIARRRTSLS